MSLRSVSIFKIRRKPPTFKTLFLFSEAMEAKHVVATTEEDGTVRLATNDKSVTLQSPTLAALYGNRGAEHPAKDGGDGWKCGAQPLGHGAVAWPCIGSCRSACHTV